MNSKITLYSALLGLAVVASLSAGQPTGRRNDGLPKLSDTLAVAKSPLEPVTVANQLRPDARNDELLEAQASQKVTQSELSSASHHTQSTRQATFEQEKDSASTSGFQADESAPSTESVSSSAPETTSESTTSTDAPEAEPTTLAPNQEDTAPTDAPTNKPNESSNKQPSETTTSTEPPTTTTAATTTTQESSEPTKEATTTTEAPSSTVRAEEKAAAEATTLAPAAEETTTKQSVSEPPSDNDKASSSKPAVDSSEAPLAETTSATTEAPQTTSTPLTKEPAAEPLSDDNKEPSIVIESASASTTTTTTTQAPTTVVANEPIQEVTTNAPQPSTTTAAPKVEDKPSEEKKESSCNHLPTYDSDEVQKVFREETTFKNGTIKGKFTYINYDQRYRLVHYTRLPYGPVKIDLVEELGKPEKPSDQQSGSNGRNEVPNAVLQLRNILPNSLFGFPFLGPNNGIAKPMNPQASGELQQSPTGPNGENGRSSMYFYSTDSISTPNLLTPNVSVSLLPGQRRHMTNQADTLAQAYYDNLVVGQAKPKPTTATAPTSSGSSSLFGAPNTFQYADNKPHHAAGLVYTYPTQPQYQYSPVPLYSFHQPPAYYQSQSSYNGGNRLLVKNQDQASHSEMAYETHIAHQPHSHEHYDAPFMFEPRGFHQPIDSSKLKLKVKTSKSLNINQEIENDGSGKSAQLRTLTSSHLAPVNNPIVQAQRSHHRQYQQLQQHHRQRSGKQNNELRPTINSSPVVYHVRSPVGRVYTLPQYQQVHAIAYDHDTYNN